MGPLTINPYPLGGVRFQSYNFWFPEEEHFDSSRIHQMFNCSCRQSLSSSYQKANCHGKES